MKFLNIILVLTVVLSSCTQKKFFTEEVKNIKQVNYQKTIGGEKTDLFTLRGENGIAMKVTNYGARIVAVCVPDKNGNPVDVVCGYNSLDEYVNNTDVYFGAIIGRYGNRIAKGQFSVEGIEYRLEQNDGVNALHGGSNGFHRRVWKANQVADNKIDFEYVSIDGDAGYPGTLTIKMSYELTSDNAIDISYSATTDKTTVLNLTNHSYFNLSGEGSSTNADHVVKINANYITAVDSTLIPTGELMPVEGTPFNFTSSATIAEKLVDDHPQLSLGGGFDHNYVVNIKGDLNTAAEVYSPTTGIKMEVITDQPGIQFYGGNFLDGSLVGKSGKPYQYRSAFCLETQCFPDSPNNPSFPSTQLKPGKEYRHTCIYKFSVK